MARTIHEMPTHHVDARHVSATDAFTLQLERDPALRATIVAVALLDRSPSWERLVERMERATRVVPTFRQKLVASPWRVATPRWVPDPDFDLTWHLRRARLPKGGGLPELLDVARHASMAAFDRDRPLWEFTLVEGMAGGRAALVLKVHHALTDGIGGVQIAAHVVDLDRRGQGLGPMPPAPTAHRSWPFAEVAESVGYDLRRAVDLGADLVRSAPGAALQALCDPAGTASAVAGELGSFARMVRPITDTRSPIMRERGLVRHLELLEVPVRDLRAAARAVDGHLNDAYIAAIAGGLRRYHEVHGACVAQLRVTMPISIREDEHDVGGNHITLVRFDLPVGVIDPAERMRAVRAICHRERHEPAIGRSELIAGMLNLLPVGVSGGMLRHVDLLASNVPGFDFEVYVAGARVEGFFPFGATLGSAANITLMSYRGSCCVGINTDADAVPDPDVFAATLREGFDEVIAVGAG